jgi:putative chitinase
MHDVASIVVRLGGSPEAADALAMTADRFAILRRDHWLAQLYVESAGFTRTRESLNYRPERLLQVFGPDSPARGRNGLKTLEQARAIVAKGPNAIAEQVYGRPWGALHLGNILFGDGSDFIGRGYKQLTGRANYAMASLGIYGDLRFLSRPYLVEQLPDAALTAGWFWKVKKCDALGDDVVAITRRVNGGLNGLAERKAALARIRRLMS